MKTKVLLIISLMCAGLLIMSCQKDNGLLPESSLEAPTALNEDAKNAKPYDPDNQAMVDPIKNYPDPFVSVTTIEYRVTKISRVSILIVNEQNERVAYIVSGYRKPGIYTAEFDAKNLPAGVYTAILTLDKLKVRERMVKLDDPESILPDSY